MQHVPKITLTSHRVAWPEKLDSWNYTPIAPFARHPGTDVPYMTDVPFMTDVPYMRYIMYKKHILWNHATMLKDQNVFKYFPLIFALHLPL